MIVGLIILGLVIIVANIGLGELIKWIFILIVLSPVIAFIIACYSVIAGIMAIGILT